MSSTLESKVPVHLPPQQAHCLASAFIARYCSPAEAYLAGLGKEVRDLFGRGDAEWADWRADRAGIQCARHAEDDRALTACCTQWDAADAAASNR